MQFKVALRSLIFFNLGLLLLFFTRKRQQSDTMDHVRLLTKACIYRYRCLLYQVLPQSRTDRTSERQTTVRTPNSIFQTWESQCESTM